MTTGDWNDVHDGPGRFRIRGWHVLAGMVGFFGVIIAVNTVFISLALRSFPGEDTRRSYMQGLAYDQVLAERDAQARIGWTAAANLDGDRVLIRVSGAAGDPVGGLVLDGTLRHPADMERDRALSFNETRPGVYEASVPGLSDGRWRLVVEAEGEIPFSVERELWRR